MLGVLAILSPSVAATNPAPGLTRTRSQTRALVCERVSAEDGSRRYPGEIRAPRTRGDYSERSVMICREQMLRSGLRSARDEAILSRLDATTMALATAAEALQPDLAAQTWRVEAFYPSGPVAAKIAFATKNALMAHGLRVSDRTPRLGAGDIDVLTRLPPDEAYPAACRRYFETGALGEGDVLLAVLIRDPRETILHAGLCSQGLWAWLQ